jgi:hypothetical protein
MRLEFNVNGDDIGLENVLNLLYLNKDKENKSRKIIKSDKERKEIKGKGIILIIIIMIKILGQ